MEEAYMIRNDGKRFACDAHFYGSADRILDMLYAGEWLFYHTQYPDVKTEFIKFVSWWAKYCLKSNSGKEQIISILKQNAKQYDFTLSHKFIDDQADIITAWFDVINVDYGSMAKILNDSLNQEFLRERYGGEYESFDNVRDVYFRVSSKRFNWYNIIWEFVHEYKNKIDTVTIERDPVVTGSAKIYQGKNGAYDHMPTEEFLSESGNPVIEKSGLAQLDVSYYLAENAGSYFGLAKLPVNPRNLEIQLNHLADQENNDPRFEYDVLFDVKAGFDERS